MLPIATELYQADSVHERVKDCPNDERTENELMVADKSGDASHSGGRGGYFR